MSAWTETLPARARDQDLRADRLLELIGAERLIGTWLDPLIRRRGANVGSGRWIAPFRNF